VPQFDQLGLAGVLRGQPVQRFAQGQQLVRRLFVTGRCRVQVESPAGATVLEAALAAGGVGENSAHGLGGGGQEGAAGGPVVGATSFISGTLWDSRLLHSTTPPTRATGVTEEKESVRGPLEDRKQARPASDGRGLLFAGPAWRYPYC